MAMAWPVVAVDNDTSGWIELDLSPLRSRVDSNPSIPIRLIANRFKSSSTDCERFIHRPLEVLIEAGQTVDALRDVTEEWRVMTFVSNHHRTLSGSHLVARVAVNATDKTLTIDLDKQP